MTVSLITLAVWGVWGTMPARHAAAWRLMRVNYKGKEGWALCLPEFWGRWRG